MSPAKKMYLKIFFKDKYETKGIHKKNTHTFSKKKEGQLIKRQINYHKKFSAFL